jgi:hypothetical protein
VTDQVIALAKDYIGKGEELKALGIRLILTENQEEMVKDDVSNVYYTNANLLFI